MYTFLTVFLTLLTVAILFLIVRSLQQAEQIRSLIASQEYTLEEKRRLQTEIWKLQERKA